MGSEKNCMYFKMQKKFSKTMKRTRSAVASETKKESISITERSFGKVGDKEATLFVISDANTKFEAQITDFGATLVDLKVPTIDGILFF